MGRHTLYYKILRDYEGLRGGKKDLPLKDTVSEIAGRYRLKSSNVEALIHRYIDTCSTINLDIGLVSSILEDCSKDPSEDGVVTAISKRLNGTEPNDKRILRYCRGLSILMNGKVD